MKVLHGGTCATVAYTGWVTAPFLVPCVVITACVVWWPLGCVYMAVTCSCCGPVPLMCYSVDRYSAGLTSPTSVRVGPAAPDAKAGGATNVRAASPVALDDTGVSTGGVGLTASWGSPAVGVFLHRSFAHGAPCFPVPTVAAPKLHPHGICCTLARRSDNLQACVCVASSHDIPCVPAVCLCVARLASAFLALWPSCFACVHARCSALGLPYLALPFRGGAVTDILHDLLCGLALSPVRHDLPSKKKTTGMASPRGAPTLIPR